MEWKNTSTNEQGLLKIPNRWLHVHYYEALNILFRFENSLRVFVYIILKNIYFDKWKDCNFTSLGGETRSIQSASSQRINQASSFGYLGFDITAPVMHLTSGELVDIIISEAYWKHFNGYFKGDKEVIKNKLQEIGAIRNSLAHFRPISREDIEVIKQNTRHTLLGVEGCLQNVFRQDLRVPTNSTDEWYKSLSILGKDYIKIIPYYSKDECWINIQLKFDTPMLHKRPFAADDFFFYKQAKLNPANILNLCAILKKNVTCVREYVNYPSLTEDRDIKVSKELHFVFQKNNMETNYKDITKEFIKVLTTVVDECDLIQQDNLARGQLVEVASTRAWWHEGEGDNKGRWNFVYDDLSQPYHPSHPDEYWGVVDGTSDVVAACRRYPWMPEDISSREGFGF